MPWCLEPLLTTHTQSVRRFLQTAVVTDQLALSALTVAGIPHYEASDYLRRLQHAGEYTDQGWLPAARSAYQALVQDVPPAAIVGGSRRMQEMPEGERPREKALLSGIDTLDDAEVLAILLRTGSRQEGVLAFAQRLLHEYDGLVGLAGQNMHSLLDSHGIGEAKATELAAAFELGRRLRQAARRARPHLRTPEEVVATIGADVVSLRHEEFWLLPLDVHSRLIGEPRRISQGDIDGTEAGPRVVFRSALVASATTCIAVHNHPTGDATPSNADRQVTKRLVQAGRILDVPLVDHVIIGDGGRFTSLRRSEPSLFG